MSLSMSSFKDKGTDNQAFESDSKDEDVTQLESPPSGASNTHLEEWARPEREQWSNSREFLLSCISMAVGIGNVWRFPFVALENGGGAFLIPYLLVLIFIGKPLYYLEFCLGQFASFGPVKLWELSPAFRGIGYGQAVSTMAVLTFYTFLMGLCVFFFFASFHSVLPWSICGPWASSNCLNSNTNTTLLNFSSFTTAAEEYFREVVLQVDPLGFTNGIGLPEWRLSLCLLASWVIIFIVQAKGVRSSGKAAYFTAIFPYLVLFVMLGRGVTLPGASKGILYFITPRWEKLLEPRVWYAAVEQALFSLTIGFGVVVMLASYNNFRHNVYRDATIISFADTFTSLLAGFTIFSILGHLAELMDVEVSEVLKGGGTSLAFISYPDALARFQHVPQLFSAMFFLMLFTLGLGSAVAYSATIITVICDQFPHIKKWKVTLWVCIVGFLVGLLYTTPQGQHILTLVNHYAGGVSIMFLMILQLVAVMWVYGLKKLLYDIEFMLHRKTGLYWKICWGVLNPLFITIVFVFSQITAKPLTYGDYVFGNVATGFGIGLAGFSVAMVPLFFLLEVWNKKNTAGISTLWDVWEVIQHTFKPTSAWSPMDPDLSKEYHHFLASKKQKSTEGK